MLLHDTMDGLCGTHHFFYLLWFVISQCWNLALFVVMKVPENRHI